MLLLICLHLSLFLPPSLSSHSVCSVAHQSFSSLLGPVHQPLSKMWLRTSQRNRDKPPWVKLKLSLSLQLNIMNNSFCMYVLLMTYRVSYPWDKKCTPHLDVFLQVFDATNTTRERRAVILSYAKERGYKVSLNMHVTFGGNVLILVLAKRCMKRLLTLCVGAN